MSYVHPAGQIVNEITSLTLVNATVKTLDHVVPAGQRHVILSVKAVNCDDVARVINMFVYNEAAATNLITTLSSASSNAGVASLYPTNASAAAVHNRPPMPATILKAGTILRVLWASGGASTGATDADGLVISYLRVDTGGT